MLPSRPRRLNPALPCRSSNSSEWAVVPAGSSGDRNGSWRGDIPSVHLFAHDAPPTSQREGRQVCPRPRAVQRVARCLHVGLWPFAARPSGASRESTTQSRRHSTGPCRVQPSQAQPDSPTRAPGRAGSTVGRAPTKAPSVSTRSPSTKRARDHGVGQFSYVCMASDDQRARDDSADDDADESERGSADSQICSNATTARLRLG